MESGSSSASVSMPSLSLSSGSNRKDPAWNYNILENSANANAVTCIFCGKVTNGGIYRAKLHQVGGNRNAKKCLKCPEHVRKELEEYMSKKRQGKINSDFVLDFEDVDEMLELEEDAKELELQVGVRGKRSILLDNGKGKTTLGPHPKKAKGKGPMDFFIYKKPEIDVDLRKQDRIKQTKNDDNLDEERREVVIQYIARFLYEAGVPFNVTRLESFKCAIEAIGQYGPNLKPPSYHEVRGKCLKKEVSYTQDMLKTHKDMWVQYGCSIMVDNCTSGTSKSIINFLINSPAGSMFLKSVDASTYLKSGEKVFELLDGVVEYVGEANVVQVITDNGSNFKLAGKLLEVKRPHLYWTPCAARCIDLMLEDISKMPMVSRTLEKAISLTGYIYNHASVLNLLRKFTKQGNLVRAGKTRFCTCYLTLRSINKHKNSLRAMFLSKEWVSSKAAKEVWGKRASKIVLMPSFWNNIVYILKVMGPLVRVLRLVDNERKPAMGNVYEAMDRAKDAIMNSFNGKEEKYMDVFKIIDERWKVQLLHPLHAAGHFLNPKSFYDNQSVEFNEEVIRGLYTCVSKLVLDENLQIKIMDELLLYKKAEGLFGFNLAIKTRKTKPPAEWWSLYGSSAPNLQKLAIKILSLTCSAFGCERNWSEFEQIHTKRRNKLEMQKLSDLIFVKHNQALKARYDSKDAIDPIALKDIDDSNEWLIGKMGVGMNEDENIETNGVFGDDSGVGDNLTWGAIARAIRGGESAKFTRKQAKATHGKSRIGVGSSKELTECDFEEEEPDFDEMEDDVEEYKSDNNNEVTYDNFSDGDYEDGL